MYFSCECYKFSYQFVSLFFLLGSTAPSGLGRHCRCFTVALRHSALQSVGRRVISPSQRPLPDNTRYTHKSQISTPPAGFEPAIPASERPQTHALDRPATGVSSLFCISYKFCTVCKPPVASGSFPRASVEGTLILRLFRYVFSPCLY